MLILEGADQVGKSTAARRLAEMAECPIRHMSRPDPDFDHLYVDRMDRVIQDRFHLGEIVYGRVLNSGGPYTSAENMRIIQAMLRWSGCLVVILYAEADFLREQIAKNNREEMYSLDQILMVNEAYRRLALSTNHGEPFCDVSFDVTDGWPTDKMLQTWLDSLRY